MLFFSFLNGESTDRNSQAKISSNLVVFTSAPLFNKRNSLSAHGLCIFYLPDLFFNFSLFSATETFNEVSLDGLNRILVLLQSAPSRPFRFFLL